MAADRTAKRMTNRNMQAAERKQQILDTAKRLFAEKGFHATSMRELNKEIGMAEALTYHYFPGGKLEILRSVLQQAQEERITSIVNFIHETFQGHAALEEVLQTLIEGVCKRILKDQDYFQILVRERGLLDEEQKEAIDELSKQPFQAVAANLTKLSKQGEIRSLDYEIAASQFLSHIVVLIVRNGQQLQNMEMKRIADFYVQLWSK